jgi:hypothetical protein
MTLKPHLPPPPQHMRRDDNVTQISRLVQRNDRTV